jgi:predicted XRE-type DNA-binding protein
MSDELDYEIGSDNVFADLGFPDAEELALKSDLATEIRETIERLGLTQVKAAALLGVDQPKVSAIVRGRLSDFSIQRLMEFLTRLDMDVEIVLRPKIKAHQCGKITVLSDHRPKRKRSEKHVAEA